MYFSTINYCLLKWIPQLYSNRNFWPFSIKIKTIEPFLFLFTLSFGPIYKIYLYPGWCNTHHRDTNLSLCQVGTLEGAYKQATGYLKSFSEQVWQTWFTFNLFLFKTIIVLFLQELIDCYFKDSSSRNACKGGYQHSSFIYTKVKKRLATYNDYSYTGKGLIFNF